MITVGVLGASGFVGSHVVEALRRRGAVVRPIPAPRLSSRESGALANGVADEARRAAATLTKAMTDCQVVVNAAGSALAGSTDLAGLVAANATMPAIAARAARTAGVRRFVHVSSAAVQGRRRVLDSSPDVQPFSAYAMSKAMGESLVLGDGPGQTVVYRPPGVHAPSRPVTASLVGLARSRFGSVAAPGRDNSPQALAENVGDAVAFLALTELSPPRIVHHPSEGQTTGQLLTDLSGRNPLEIPRFMARSVVAASLLAGRLVPSLAATARRLEVLWFGQLQAPSWLTESGWNPVLDRQSWTKVGEESIRSALASPVVFKGLNAVEVIRGLGLGGAETLLALRATQSGSNLRVRTQNVLHTDPEDTHYRDAVRQAGWRVYETSTRDVVRSGLSVIQQVRRLEGVDVIISHSPVPTLFLKVARLFGVLRLPIVQVVHSADYRPIYQYANRLTNWLAAGGIAVSEDVANSAGSWGLRPRLVVYGGVDTAAMHAYVSEKADVRSDLLKSKGIPDNTPVICSVGRLVPRKGHDDLIRAFAQADTSAHLVIVGDGPEAASLAALVSELDVSAEVHFVGPYSPAWHWMASSDMLCHTSRVEGLPVVLMEALALGLPVLATDFSGAAEAKAHDPELVTVVPRGDIEQISRQMESVQLRGGRKAEMLASLELTYWSAKRFAADMDLAIVSILTAK